MISRPSARTEGEGAFRSLRPAKESGVELYGAEKAMQKLDLRAWVHALWYRFF